MDFKKKEKVTLTFNQLWKNPANRDELLEKVQKEEIELILIPANSGKTRIQGIFKLIKAEIG